MPRSGVSPSITGVSWFGVDFTASPVPSQTNHVQPEPNRFTPGTLALAQRLVEFGRILQDPFVRVFAALIVVNVALFAAAWAVYEYWPESESSPYECATLDNGRDEPVEVCISKHTIYVEDCDRLIGRGSVIADPIPHQIVRDGHDKYCLEDIP